MSQAIVKVTCPHALVSFHLTRLYMRRTSVQNWWCHHDTSHFGLANFNPIHVNSDISMCAISTARSAIFATLESHSWLVILCHVTCTSTPLQQSAASAIVTMSLVSIILSEPTLTWADLTQIQHLLNQTFDYNWPLTFLALITNFDFDQLSKVHFSFFNYAYPKSFFAYILILGLFFHMALTSLKFDRISFLGSLIHKICQLTHIFIPYWVGSTIHPMQPFMDTFMYHSMHLRGIFPSLYSKLKTSSNLYLEFERVLKILIYYGLLCVMVQEVQYMEYSTLNSNNLLYTLEKNIRNKILVHFYGLCA